MADMIRSAWCSIVVVAALAEAAAGQTAGSGASGPWVMENSGMAAGLRGIHAVSANVAWASGTGGTILRTVDGGATWQRCATPPGAEKLDFRGIWAWDAQTAIAMSSGPGDASRLYKTVDGCGTWKLLFTNPDKDGFWDAMAFWNHQDGEILGDPVLSDVGDFKIVAAGPGFPDKRNDEGKVAKETRFATFSTWDGGKTWNRSMNGFLGGDPARSGAFAASNSSLVRFAGWGWIGIGGKDGSFVYRGMNATDLPLSDGLYWQKIAAPIRGGTDSSGVFSVSFRNREDGVAVGGDYAKPNESDGSAAWSADGGKTWTAAAKPPHGFRSAVAWDAAANAWIAAGTNGSDVSYDDGKTWVSLENGNWNALSLPWVVGPDGRIGKLDAQKLKN
ncbi:MAG: hypothetical protein WCA44_01450 [Acidobacteriaceae bacterium]